MILPIITAISREVFAQTPRLHEEAALALGATRWEMIRLAVFPYARSGMVSAVMLGLGRALGETMAVAMVLSAGGGITFNLISPVQPGEHRLQHRLQLQGGHPGQGARPDRDRPGAVRRDLPGQLRRPLDRRPQRAEAERDEHDHGSRPAHARAGRADATAALPQLGARSSSASSAGRRCGPAARSCSAGASSPWALIAGRPLHRRAARLVARSSRTAARPSDRHDHRAGLDGLRRSPWCRWSR